jgi:predicted ester cyclase
MSAEQIVRSFLTTFEERGIEAAQVYLDSNLVLRQPGMPDGGQKDFINIGRVVKLAMPDFQWGVTNIEAQGNTFAVNMRWTGTHNGVHELSTVVPGAPDIPPTHKQVSVNDRFVFTVENDLITVVDIQWPPNGGMPAFLAQVGVALPTP